MAITITPEQVEFLTSKGVKKESMQADIEKARKQGIGDDEIQDSLYSKIESMGFDPNKQKRNYDNPPIGELPPVPATSETPDNVGSLINNYNANNDPYAEQQENLDKSKQFLSDADKWQNNYEKEIGVTAKNTLQGSVQKTGLPAVGSDILEGIKNIPSGIGHFAMNTAKDLGTTGYNLLTHPTGILDMAGVASHEIANLPANLINSGVGSLSALVSSANGQPYHNSFHMPNTDEIGAYLSQLLGASPQQINKYDDILRQKQNMYPSGALLGDAVALNPIFAGGGTLSNIGKASGLGFMGTDGDLSQRVSSAGTGAAMIGVPELGKIGFEKAYPNLVNLATGINPESTKIAINSVNGGDSIFKNNIEELTRQTSGKMQMAKDEINKTPDYFTVKEDQIYNKYLPQYADLSHSIKIGIGELFEEYGNKIGTTANRLSKENVGYSDFVGDLQQRISSLKTKGANVSAAEEINKPFIKQLNDFIDKQTNSDEFPQGINNLYEYKKMQERKATEPEIFEDAHGTKVTRQEAEEAYGRQPEELGFIKISGEAQEITPESLIIPKSALHEIKKFEREYVRTFGKDSAPSNGLREHLYNATDRILDLNTKYNSANKDYENLSKLLENNRWLNNGELSQKLASADSKASVLREVKPVLKHLDDLLPNSSKFYNKFDNISFGHNSELNMLSSAKEELNNFMKQIEDSTIKRPTLVGKKINNTVDYNKVDAFEKLNKLASPQNKFNEELANLKALNDFVGKDEKLDWRQAHAGSRLVGLATLGIGGAAASHGSLIPSLSSVGATLLIDQLMRPSFHKGVIENYGKASKVPKSLAQFGSYQSNKKEK